MRRNTRSLIILLCAMLAAGCATVSYTPGTRDGFYHEVSRGETLWGISKEYSVSLREIVKINRIPNASKIEVGQLILIPRKKVSSAKPKAASYNSSKYENFMWPVKGKVVSYFGSTLNMVKNKGIDIRAREGLTVAASRSGRVSFASDGMKGYGKTIIIDHAGDFQTVYAHNKENLVMVGQKVNRGEAIARVGQTGRTGYPTLHFEIRKGHEPQNPFYYLP